MKQLLIQLENLMPGKLYTCSFSKCKNCILYLNIHNIYTMTHGIYLFYRVKKKPLTVSKIGKMLWCAPVISTWGRLRQKNLQFANSLGYSVRPCCRGRKKPNNINNEKCQELWTTQKAYSLEEFWEKRGLVG